MTEINGDDLVGLLELRKSIPVQFTAAVTGHGTAKPDTIADIVSYRPVELDMIAFTCITRSSNEEVSVYIGLYEPVPLIILPFDSIC